jgi:isopentenyl diphosphate isomerase/L-lactate dehydrogenase-like FMN-dependent dehydrogenase
MNNMIDRVKEIFRMIRIGGQPKGVDALYNLDDIKRCAEKRLPKMIYDFIDGGAYDEITMASNKSDFSRITFRPKMLADVTRRNYRVNVVGQELEFPVLISPAGLLR